MSLGEVLGASSGRSKNGYSLEFIACATGPIPQNQYRSMAAEPNAQSSRIEVELSLLRIVLIILL